MAGMPRCKEKSVSWPSAFKGEQLAPYERRQSPTLQAALWDVETLTESI